MQVDDGPPYRRIAAELARRIESGELSPGDPVPSTRRITREWGVAIATATKALAVLREAGMVRVVPRVGTVVAPAPVARPPRAAATPGRAGDMAGRAGDTPGRAGDSLDRGGILAAAVGIADRDGLPGLSMRVLAGRLGVPTMSLYRYVRNKDELVLLMIDEAFGEAAFPEPAPAGWRARLEVSARLQWASYRRHPWLAEVVSMTRPQPLVNLFRFAEWSLRALEGLGLDQTAMFDIHFTLCNHVRGLAINLAPEADAAADTGMSGDEWAAVSEPVRALVESGRFPTLRRAAELGNYELDLESLFEFGLSRLLDGLDPFTRRGHHQSGR